MKACSPPHLVASALISVDYWRATQLCYGVFKYLNTCRGRPAVHIASIAHVKLMTLITSLTYGQAADQPQLRLGAAIQGLFGEILKTPGSMAVWECCCWPAPVGSLLWVDYVGRLCGFLVFLKGKLKLWWLRVLVIWSPDLGKGSGLVDLEASFTLGEVKLPI